MINRRVCGGFIGLAFIVNSCLGQVIDSEDDSLLIDSFHAATNKGVSRPIDTVAQHHAINSAPTDTAAQQREIAKSVAIDTAARHIETNRPGPTDTIALHHETAKPDSTRPIRHTYEEETPKGPVVHDLSPFSSDHVHCLGVSLEYFSYAEVSSTNDIFGDNPPRLIIGAPKSTEYGLMFGFNYEGCLRQHGSRILFRPKLDVQIGVHQAYDGSTQALPIFDQHGDTIQGEFQFLPVKIYKSNYFVQAALDIGYCLTHAIVPFYLYSGVRGKLWYRDMVADTTSYSNQITNSEVYYWFSAPIGLSLSMPVSPDLALGVDASCDLMFYGQMQALNSAWDAENTYKTVSPAVTLGDRPAYRVEFSITYKSSNETVYRFAPYFTMYSFGQSETEISQSFVNGVYTQGSDVSFNEPASASWLLGAKIQIVFMSPYTRTR